VSQKEQLAELLAARKDCRQKRDVYNAAKGELKAAVSQLEELWSEIEGDEQGRLPFPSAAKPTPKKPHGSGDQAAADMG